MPRVRPLTVSPLERVFLARRTACPFTFSEPADFLDAWFTTELLVYCYYGAVRGRHAEMPPVFFIGLADLYPQFEIGVVCCEVNRQRLVGRGRCCVPTGERRDDGLSG